MANAPADTIYVLNGPGLDLSETSGVEANDHAKLAEVERLCADTAGRFGLKIDCRQPARESDLIDSIQQADENKAAGIVINAGRYLQRSLALRDALAGSRVPAVEVHVSNRHAGDNFRHQTFTTKAAIATLTGFGIDGYRLAISGLAAGIGVTAKADVSARHQTESFRIRSWRASLKKSQPRNSPVTTVR